MSIPTPFNPLGTLGRVQLLDSCYFRALNDAENTRKYSTVLTTIPQTTDYEFEIVVSDVVNKRPSASCCFVARWVNNEAVYVLYTYNTMETILRYGNAILRGPYLPTGSIKSTLRTSISGGVLKLALNDAEVTGIYGTDIEPVPAGLFWRLNGFSSPTSNVFGATNVCCNFRFYRLTAKQNGEVVHDLRPCRLSSGEIAVIDLKTSEICRNQGEMPIEE